MNITELLTLVSMLVGDSVEAMKYVIINVFSCHVLSSSKYNY